MRQHLTNLTCTRRFVKCFQRSVIQSARLPAASLKHRDPLVSSRTVPLDSAPNAATEVQLIFFAVVYRNSPAAVYSLMHNFRSDWNGRLQPCLDGRQFARAT